MAKQLQYDQLGHAGTLGQILYAGKSRKLITEDGWAALIQSIATGDQHALYKLYERAHRPVFTLIMRITRNWETTEELTVDVFYDIWQRASSYDPANDAVLGWIMNLARSRAIDRAHFDQRKKGAKPNLNDPMPMAGTDTYQQNLLDDQGEALNLALSLQERLARRIAVETGNEEVLPDDWNWSEPQWEGVSPGISCKLLSTDTKKHSVSMMVRLAQGVEYPPHTHAGVEELHLLDGELWINERKLFAGDYHRAEHNTSDHRVWSRTGCTCVLMTSIKDRIL